MSSPTLAVAVATCEELLSKQKKVYLPTPNNRSAWEKII